MYDIYSNAKSDRWRFTLGKSGARRLITIGLNPSTANPCEWVVLHPAPLYRALTQHDIS